MYAEPLPQYALPRLTSRRIAAGVAVSLAVHVVVLMAMRNGLSARHEVTAPPQRMMVWVRPLPEVKPPPEPVVETRKVPPPTPPARTPRKRAPAATPDSGPTPVIAVQPNSAAPAPDAFTVPAQQAERSSGGFDQEAAKAAARRIASEEAKAHPEEAGTIATDTRLARSIARAKRPDCKDGIPGGLLAPIYLLMEKKDHGCKW